MLSEWSIAEFYLKSSALILFNELKINKLDRAVTNVLFNFFHFVPHILLLTTNLLGSVFPAIGLLWGILKDNRRFKYLELRVKIQKRGISNNSQIKELLNTYEFDTKKVSCKENFLVDFAWWWVKFIEYTIIKI